MFFGKNRNETPKRTGRSSFDEARRLDLEAYIRRIYIDPAAAQNSAAESKQKENRVFGIITGPKRKNGFFANALSDRRAEKNDADKTNNPDNDVALNEAAVCEDEASYECMPDAAPVENVCEEQESYPGMPDAAPVESVCEAAEPVESVYEAAGPHPKRLGSGFREEPFDIYHESKLAERMKHLSDTYSEYLLYLIREHGMDNAEVWKNAIVDKKVFSKIKNNRTYHPNKLTALCLCVGAHLNLDESKDLLARAGYALSPCDKTDIIFAYFLENEIYDMIELDIQLEEHGQPCIIA